MWQSRSEAARSYVVNGDVTRYLIDSGLRRHTQYTVYVYATNARGKGSNSQMINVTTGPEGEQLPSRLGWAGLGWTGLGWAGLGWARLGWAGLGW